MEEQERGIISVVSSERMRDYRKGNWTLQETLILIEAKKMDDQRRRKTTKKHSLHYSEQSPITSSSGSVMIKPPPAVTELRWKWVEDYCWRKGCYRSQNQCNDKWDNLMRDYKKVREYQRNVVGSADLNAQEIRDGGDNKSSYWKMDKVERKDKGLPTNMLPQIYQALFEVVEPVNTTTATTTTATTTAAATAATVGLASPVVVSPQLLLSPLQQQQPPPPSPPQLVTTVVVPSVTRPQHGFQLGALLGPETSEKTQSESPAKRKKTDETPARGGGAALGEGTSGGGGGGGGGGAGVSTSARPVMTPSMEEVGSAINRIVDVIQANEEREERRHREMMSLHETRLRLEESRLEIHRQSLHTMLDAIHKLTSSFETWANKNQGSS